MNTHEKSGLDGVGLWNSFTRSFTSPMLAMFDLIDNSFDAAPQETGHIHIDFEVDEQGNKTGLSLVNDCKELVGPLSEVLTLFKSSKSTETEKIGENGVGIKQGCAVLSDLSFIISRDRDVYGLGIVARDLQTNDRIHFPSFSFKCDANSELLYKCLESTFFKDEALLEIIKKYGNGEATKGIRQLVRCYMKISTGLWNSRNMNHVFGVIMYDLKHGHGKLEEIENDPDEEEMEIDKTRNFLHEIEDQLPQHYLRVPRSFDFQVNGVKICFSFWQNRLCDMTLVPIQVNRIIPYVQQHQLEFVPNPNDEYELDVYLGFDAVRINRKVQKTATLLYHSRRAGRLIKKYDDARYELRLTSGGTNYCQGLTIIVDDKHGMLPLNPTKQDIAFGEESYGAIHEDNIKLWLGAVVKTYYNFYLQQCPSNSKAELTDIIKQKKANSCVLQWKPNDEQRSIDECHFSTFEGIKWAYIKKSHSLFARSKDFSVVHRSVKDLQLMFPMNNAEPKIVPKRVSPKKKKAKREKPDTDTDDELIESTQIASRQRPKRKKTPSTITNDSVENARLENARLRKENTKLRNQLSAIEMEYAENKKQLDKVKFQLKYNKLRGDRLAAENEELEAIVAILEK